MAYLPLEIMAFTANTILGRYTIRSLLGEGGMGKVYLAQDNQLRRFVALKLLSAEASQNQELLQRFTQEAHAVSKLNHPNILTIYEIGQIDEMHFISTEYVEGITLRHCIKNRQLKLSRILDIAIGISSALTAAHEAGIIHRDIKPENIMLRDDEYVKVLDFGIAKLVKSHLSTLDFEAETVQAIKTNPGTIMGTIIYMSPEQTRGLEVDSRSDIWSLGVVLYEMITSKIPFDGITASDVMAAILMSDPQPLSLFSQNTPLDLELIINKCLCKEANDRYQDINEVLLDLKKLKQKTDAGESLEKVAGNKDIKRIAILPFRNLTSDSSVDFYEFSLADAVITELARLRSLIVCPSSVVAKYLLQDKDPLEIGKELKVNAVLATSFLTTKNRIRVTTQLIDVINENILWGERIDTDFEDIITVQDVISQRIVDGLQLKFSSSEVKDLAQQATDNSAAYVEYLRGRDNFGRFVFRTGAPEDCEAAIANFKCAIELDPKFALAHSGLGACYANRMMRGMGEPEDYTFAEEAFNKVFQYDLNIVEARVLMVFIYLSRGKKIKARQEIEILQEKFPNTAPLYFIKAVMHRLNGEYKESFEAWDKLTRLDPAAHVVASYNRARIFLYQDEYEKALSELADTAKIEPNHLMIRFFYAVAIFRSGDPALAIELLNNLLVECSKDFIRPYLAICLSALGQHEEARKQITDSVKKVASIDHDISYWLATAYVMEKQYDEALKWLEYSINLGNENLPWFKRNPIWKPLHNDPKFKKLMKQIEVSQGM